jgi:hypothetical protein
MRLAGHIARKDVRALAWPVAVWLMFLLVTAWLQLRLEWQPELASPAAAADWMRTVRSVAILAGVIGASATALLAGALVLEDRVAGRRAFWLTRPIAGRHMLAGKLLGAAILLVGAPVVALVPGWLVAGFGGIELGRAVLGGLAGQAALALLAMGLAVLTANLGQHALAVLAATVLGELGLFALPAMWPGAREVPAALESQAVLILALVAGAALVSLLSQYTTRRRAIGWCAWGLALVAVVAVRLGWERDLTGGWRFEAPTAAESRLSVTPRMTEVLSGGRVRCRVAVDGGPREFAAPVGGHGVWKKAGGAPAAVDFTLSEGWGQAAARRVAGLASSGGPVEWELVLRPAGGGSGAADSQPGDFSGRVEFARMRGTVLYELPVQPGAVARRGGTRTRVVGWAKGAAETLLVEERDAIETGLGVRMRPGRVDRFLLVHRASGTVRQATALGQVAAGWHGLVHNVLALTPAPAPAGLATREGWTLVRVRFEPAGWFTREFDRLPLVAGETVREGGP